MPFKKFMTYTVTGAPLWTIGLTLMGFFFGKMMPPEYVDHYLLPIVLLIIILSFAPSVYHLYKERKLAQTETGGRQ
mgnify:CR=1 FL=1